MVKIVSIILTLDEGEFKYWLRLTCWIILRSHYETNDKKISIVIDQASLYFSCLQFNSQFEIQFTVFRVPTAPGKMTTVFPVLEKYWNFIILLKSWKNGSELGKINCLGKKIVLS